MRRHFSTPGVVFRILLVAALSSLASGCISFLASSNADLADRIQREYNVMEAAAEAGGVDVEGLIDGGQTQDGEVELLLLEAHEIAGNAQETKDKSIELDAMNFSELNEAALQSAALTSFDDDLREFEQAAAWTSMEIENLAVIDRNILALSNYTECGGSSIGDAKCVAEGVSNGFSAVNGLAGFFTGVSVPGGQVLGILAATTAVAAEIDKAIKRGQFFGDRESRIDVIQHVAHHSLMPSFINLESNMRSAINGLPEHLRPVMLDDAGNPIPGGWEGQLDSANSRMSEFMSFIDGMDGLFEQYKAEEQARNQAAAAALMGSPEEVAASMELLNEDAEARAFSRFWDETGRNIERMTSALGSVRQVRGALQASIDEKEDAEFSADERAVLGVEEGEDLKTQWLRQGNDTLVQKLDRINEISHELDALLPNYSASQPDTGNSCPLQL